MTIPCFDCKGERSIGPFNRGGTVYRCERCQSHGCTSGIEPCADCRDDSDVLDGDEAVCWPCAEKRGVCPMVMACLPGLPTCAGCLARPFAEMSVVAR